MNTTNKYILLTALYFSQGLPFGFFSEAIEPIAAMRGMSDQALGLLSLLALPWTLKFLWAPFVDRYYSPRIGPRKSWILPLQLCTILAMVIVSQIDSTADFAWLLLIVFVVNLFASTQDVATDGLACSALKPHERGIGNGIQVAAYRFGMIIGGGVLLILIDDVTWEGAFLIIAGLLTVATIIVAISKEPAIDASNKQTGTEKFGEQLRRYVFHPGILAWLLFIFFYKFGDSVASGMVKKMLVTQGYTLKDIGSASGLVGSVTGLAGALFGGWLCSKLSPIRLLPLFIVLQAVTSLGYAAISYRYGGHAMVYGVMGFESFVSGMHTAGIFTLMMSAVRPFHEGNDYTIQASVIVLGTGVGKALSGFISSAGAGPSNYAAPIFVGTVLILLVLVPFYWVRRRGGFSALRTNNQ